MKRGRIEIKTYDDLNDIMSEMFEEFLYDFRGRGLTYPSENTFNEQEEGIQWYYTDKGMALINRWLLRMKRIFLWHFPDGEFKMRTPYYVEY